MTTAQGTAAPLAETPQAVALPNARFLNYLGNVTTPTRVRKMARLGMILLSVPAFALAGLCLLFPVMRFIDLMTWAPALFGGRPMSVGHAAALVLRTSIGALLGMLIFSMAGLLLVILGRMVLRGNARACHLSVVTLIPCIPAGVFAALYCGMTFIIRIVPLWKYSRNVPLAMLLFMGFWLSCVAILLVKDMMTYLVWISRNPAAEKAAVPFLPRQDDSAR